MSPSTDARFEGVHCTITVKRPAAGVVVVVFEGFDVGELKDAPLVEIERALNAGPIELFIDARAGQAASVEVSGAWARWLGAHRSGLTQVSMLTGTRFIQLSAELVKRFAQLEDVMRLYTDAKAFDEALAQSIAAA